MTSHAECANITVLCEMNVEWKAQDSQSVTTQQVDGGNTIHHQIKTIKTNPPYSANLTSGDSFSGTNFIISSAATVTHLCLRSGALNMKHMKCWTEASVSVFFTKTEIKFKMSHVPPGSLRPMLRPDFFSGTGLFIVNHKLDSLLTCYDSCVNQVRSDLFFEGTVCGNLCFLKLLLKHHITTHLTYLNWHNIDLSLDPNCQYWRRTYLSDLHVRIHAETKVEPPILSLADKFELSVFVVERAVMCDPAQEHVLNVDPWIFEPLNMTPCIQTCSCEGVLQQPCNHTNRFLRRSFTTTMQPCKHVLVKAFYNSHATM